MNGVLREADIPIVLVGLAAAGKTRIGRDLARVLKMAFIDTDHEIEQIEKRTIARIFQEDGEDYFRDIESAVLREALEVSGGPCVVAAGGGAVLRPGNADLVFGPGAVAVWLRASVPLLVARMQGSEHRPLLAREDRAAALGAMAVARHPVYGRARLIVDVDDRWPVEIVRIITEKLGQSIP